MKFAIIGLGFIAQKHLDAIKDVGGELVAACDINEKCLDKAVECQHFLDWHKMLKSDVFKKVEWVSICTPNYLHAQMIRACARSGKKVICEKPLVIHPTDLKEISELKNVYTVMQLRYNEELKALKKSIHPKTHYEGTLNINLHRGEFYFRGWKGQDDLSGGLLYNIGIHYIDLLVWLFGEPKYKKIYDRGKKYMDGKLSFENGYVNFHISIAAPMENQTRRLTINGKEYSLDYKFENLHTRVYEETLAGRGITPEESGKSIKLISEL